MDSKINAIKEQLKQLGLRPTKNKGQNFLIDQDALVQIVAAAELKPSDFVLEIGPGLGVLTEKLLDVTDRVLAVELDKALYFYLKKKFLGQKKLQLILADVLKIKNNELLENFKVGQTASYKLVANLPYNISKPVLQKFLSYEPKPELMVVLLQKEVAEKIIGQDHKMGLLSVAVQLHGQPEIVAFVPKEAFFPQPQIESAIVKIKPYKEGLSPEVLAVLKKNGQKQFNEIKFWQLVKIGFSAPRKQMHNNLAAGYHLPTAQIKAILEKNNLIETVRAEDLSLKDWACLYLNFVS